MSVEVLTITNGVGESLFLDLVLGGTTPYLVTGWTPYGSTDIGTSDTDAAVGQWGGTDREGGRDQRLDTLLPTNPVSAQAALENAIRFLRPSSQSFTVEWPQNGTKRCTIVRSRGVGVRDGDAVDADTVVSWRSRALDPGYYGVTRSAPVAVGGSTSVSAGGYEITPQWTCVIPGPVTNPSFSYTSATGTRLIAWASLIVASGKSLHIECRDVNGFPDAYVLDGTTKTSVAGSALDADASLARIVGLTNAARTFAFAASSGGTTAAVYWRDRF